MTSQTTEKLTCPDKDIEAQSTPDGSVKVTFLKKCKIKD